jgi:hypothetical protein
MADEWRPETILGIPVTYTDKLPSIKSMSSGECLWTGSVCVACGSEQCYGDCDLYPDWEHDFLNPEMPPRRDPGEYATTPLQKPTR